MILQGLFSQCFVFEIIIVQSSAMSVCARLLYALLYFFNTPSQRSLANALCLLAIAEHLSGWKCWFTYWLHFPVKRCTVFLLWFSVRVDF